MIYILVNTETDRRVRWWPDPMRVEALQTMNQWNGWRGGQPGLYRLDTAQNDDLVNNYPQGDIPDAMGGHPVALMDDGGTLCEFCVADPFNPIHDARTEATATGWSADGWGVIGWFNSAEADERVQCDHCNKILNEGTPDDTD